MLVSAIVVNEYEYSYGQTVRQYCCCHPILSHLINHLTLGRDEGNEPEPTDCSSTRSANDADRFCSLSGFVSGDPGRATRCFEPTEEERLGSGGGLSRLSPSGLCISTQHWFCSSTGILGVRQRVGHRGGCGAVMAC